MAQGMNRRTFLAAAAVAGVGAGTVVGGGRARAADAAQTVVVGVMGLGRGRSLATSFAAKPGVVIKYVCDTDQARAEAGAKALQSIGAKPPQIVGDFRRILDDAEVDLLVCAAPNHWHGPATILACAANKHVYVEKPCCHNPLEGEWMVQAARKYQRAVQMGSQRRSAPGTIEAMEKLREGIIGRVYLARAVYNAMRPSIGTGRPAPVPPGLDYELWQGPAPRQPYLDNRIPYNWHWFWHWGNGELGNNGVHSLDLCRWGLGVDFPTRVTSSGGRYRWQDDQQTPDTQTVCFEFDGGRQITWQGLSCHRHDAKFVTFYGEDGALEIEGNGTYTVFDARDRPRDKAGAPGVGDAEHVANIIEAIRSDRPLALNAEIAEGHKSTLLCHLGNIAHRTGRTLHCESANGRIRDDAEAAKLWGREYEPGWEPQV